MEEYCSNRDGKSSPGRLLAGSPSPEEQISLEGEVSSEDVELAIKGEASTEGAPVANANKSQLKSARTAPQMPSHQPPCPTK